MPRTFAGYVIVALLVAAGVFAISPYWSVAGLVKAAQDENFDAVADHVDFERLRQNLKGQIMTTMQPDLEKAGAAGGFAVLGAALGTMIVDRTLEAMITPEGISQAIKNGLGETDRSRIGSTIALIGNGAGDWIDASTFRITADNGVSFTWRRHGVSWRMTSMGVPELSGKASSVPASSPTPPSEPKGN